jgi:phosphoribosylaminoimidazolecarboxamide formyltransferase/IMP cyclohydrolase
MIRVWNVLLRTKEAVMRAFLSVSDKTGLVDFARGLNQQGVELVASGGTATALREAGLPVTSVEDLTGLPSVLGGRVKTLHPAIHGGILAQDTPNQATLVKWGWQNIDFVVVNLYPFVETISQQEVSEAEAIENIDIGGVALIRAAAKNFARVTVITQSEDYGRVLEEVQRDGCAALETRRALAQKAFGVTAAYDAAIAGYFTAGSEAGLPEALSIALPQAEALRYGENPHQQAALYMAPGTGPLGGDLLQGKQLSYNNLLDIDAAWAAAEDYAAQTIVIVKHLSPCGIASGTNLPAAFTAALASDPLSAFGGVIACNRPFDEATVEAMGDLFVEAIAAPEFTPGALERLQSRKNCRVLRMGPVAASPLSLRSVRGGLLAQTPDSEDAAEWRVMTERQPSEAEMSALEFAWRAVKHIKSNAILFAAGEATVGIGGGLTSRVDAVKLAAEKAGDRAKGAVMASDAFFPFPDGVEAAAAAGVTAVVQPGGSVKDQEVNAAANRLGLAMCFTGMRHFRH